MKETALQRDGRELAEASYWVSCRGSNPTRNGTADYWFMKLGHGFVVEFKKKKGKQSEVQKHEQKICIRRGVPYYVVKSLIQMRDVLLIEEAKFSKQELASMEV